MSGFVIHQQPERLAVVRMDPTAAIPAWAATGTLTAVVRTPLELSIVCDASAIPADATAERGWIAFMLEGPFPFSMTGVLSSVLVPLAEAEIPIMAISTFDTDFVLVKTDMADAARIALERAGHTVHPTSTRS